MKMYLFFVTPTPDPEGTNVLPKAWWLRGAFGPLVVLVASTEGWRIVQPSLRDRATQLLAGFVVGLLVLVGVFESTALLIFQGHIPTTATSALWGVVALLAFIGIFLPIGPHIRKIAGRHPKDFIPIEVLSARGGFLHQELHILGEGHGVRVQTNALRRTMTAALQLARGG